MNIHNSIEKILNDWPEEKQKPFGGNQLADFIRKDFVTAISQVVLPINSSLRLKGSAGAGNWASVPWLAIMDSRITNSTEDGVYPVYLFRGDASGVYLSLGQGTTDPKKRLGNQAGIKFLQDRASDLRQKFPALENWHAGPTDLRSSTPLGQSYEAPNIGYRFYEKRALPSEEVLKKDLIELLGIYKKIVTEWPLDEDTSLQDSDEICVEFCGLLRGMKRDRGKLYKPAMMACVLEAIDSGALSKNQIDFDWVAPLFIQKMTGLGQTVGNAQACMPYVHLQGDSFWALKYYNDADTVHDGGEGVGAVRKKIRYAYLKEPYWAMLQDGACRARCLQVLKELLSGNKEEVSMFETNTLIAAFERSLTHVGYQFDEALPMRLLAALPTKPFMLLTGLSGSGKTQLAQVFSKWICTDKSQVELIAVGADWTSNENLLGYPDALNAGCYRKPDNGALDLILRAKDDPENPYFLILDEMNLSHVERYFADFLSAMESSGAINLHDDTGADWDAGDGRLKVPAKLTIPKNLFVIGTVNVDETTYMFSPKVLDRANVIEFRVSDDEMESFLKNPVKPNLDDPSFVGAGAKYAKTFVEAAKQKQFLLDEQEQVSEVLMKFFPELKEAGAEFGYRTAHEICRFVYFHKALSSKDWKIESAMDAAIMQKLLPKLHGARRKLEPILEKLEKLCEKDYPRSLEKVQRMLKRLREHGFTSFAEA